jgi:hypothetical protein
MKAPVGQFFASPGNAPDCAIGALIGRHCQILIKITRIDAGVSFNGVEYLGNARGGVAACLCALFDFNRFVRVSRHISSLNCKIEDTARKLNIYEEPFYYAAKRSLYLSAAAV